MKKIVSESLNEWLNEQKKESTFGCVMLNTNIRDWEDIHTGGIDPEDVYKKPLDDSFGLEETPHMTIIYGIHEDEVTPEQMINVIKENMEDVTVSISKISIFENDEYDVVKYDIPVTEQIQAYRNMFINNFENTQSFPEYHPHMTIAYVAKGAGNKYSKELETPFNVTFTKGIYSYHERNEEGDIESKEKGYVFNTPEDEINLDKL
jgi:2'-5' RNA ligase